MIAVSPQPGSYSGIGTASQTLSDLESVAQMKRGRRQTPLLYAGFPRRGNRIAHLRVRRTVALMR